MNPLNFLLKRGEFSGLYKKGVFMGEGEFAYHRFGRLHERIIIHAKYLNASMFIYFFKFQIRSSYHIYHQFMYSSNVTKLIFFFLFYNL